MKKLLLLAVCFFAVAAHAQKKDKDEVIYYTDSEVKRSRFAIALTFNPNYTDRRIIGDEIPSGGGLDLENTDDKGSFQLNYNAGFFFELGSSLDIGLGFGRTFGEYEVQNARIYGDGIDTTVGTLHTNLSMYTIPFKLNFNTRITDVLDLEVVPVIEFNILDSYDQRMTPADGAAAFNLGENDDVRNINTAVGLGLGGTYIFTENWGVFLRGNIKYMLNPLVERVNYPRETLYSFGADIGIKYSF